MDKMDKALERLKLGAQMAERYYKQPLIVCYSGGKDSEVLVDLAIISKTPIIVQHSHTTIDAPHTVYHVRNNFKKWEEKGIECQIKYPVHSFWEMLGIKTTPPTRRVRWCCETQKEFASKNSCIATGVRWQESSRRKNDRGVIESNADKRSDRIILMNDNDDKRQLIDRCVNLNLTTVNPLIDWTTEERNDYIEDRHIVCNPLYCMGFNRVGCVGCCLSSKKQKVFEFEMFPKYKDMYLRGFQKMLELRNYREKHGLSKYNINFQTAKDIFRFYIEENQIFGQMDFNDFMQDYS